MTTVYVIFYVILYLSIAVLSGLVVFFLSPGGPGRVKKALVKFNYTKAPLSIWEDRPTEYGDDEKMFTSALNAVYRLGDVVSSQCIVYKSPQDIVKMAKKTGRLPAFSAAIVLMDLLSQRGKNPYLLVITNWPIVYCNMYEINIQSRAVRCSGLLGPAPPNIELLSIEDLKKRIAGV